MVEYQKRKCNSTSTEYLPVEGVGLMEIDDLSELDKVSNLDGLQNLFQLPNVGGLLQVETPKEELPNLGGLSKVEAPKEELPNVGGLSKVEALKEELDESWRKGLHSMEKRLTAVLTTNLKDQFPHDVTFCVGKEEELITGHKFIISLASPVLLKLIKSAEKSGENTIKLSDVDPEIFKILLQHFYLDKLKISDEQLMDTMFLAQRFEIPDIMDQYSQQLKNNLTKTNCVTIFQAADSLSTQNLKAVAKDFINKNFEDILNSEKFLQFTEMNLCEILKSDTLTLSSELELFKAVRRWGENHYNTHKNDTPEENVREVIKKIVPYIRFPTMSLEEFVSTVEPANLLSSDDRADLFKYFALRENQWKPSHPIVLKKFSTKMRSWRNDLKLTVDLFSNWQCSSSNFGLNAYSNTNMYDSFQFIGEEKIQLYLKAVGFGTHPSYINRQVTVSVKVMRELEQQSYNILAHTETTNTTYIPTSSTTHFVDLNKSVRIFPGESYRVLYCVTSGSGRISAQSYPVAEAILFQHPSNPSKTVKVKYTPGHQCLTALKFSHQEY